MLRHLSQQAKGQASRSEENQPRSCRLLVTDLRFSQTGKSESSERHPAQREMLVTARCGPGELKGPHLVPFFIGSGDD